MGQTFYIRKRYLELNSLAALQDVIQRHFSSKAAELQSFVETGYSFEEWFNWELFYALKASESDIQPKPSYRHRAQLEDSCKTGDVSFTKDGLFYIVEVALVHDYTSEGKWRDKVHDDRGHLLTLKQQENVVPIQLLLLVSDYDSLGESPSWTNWLQSLKFWNDPKDIDVKIRLPQKGVACIVGWAV